jgi:D-aspartate ligase
MREAIASNLVEGGVLKPDSTGGGWPSVALFDNYWAPTLAFANSLGRRGVPLHVYGAGAGRWSRYCARRRPCPPVEDAERFLPWLRERVRSGEITRVAPTTDLIAYYTSCLRDEFPTDVKRAIAPLEEVERALIKSRFSEACEAIGQGVPLTRNPMSLEAAVEAAHELGYPLILKPKSHLGVGASERGHLIQDEAELRRRFAAYDPAPGQQSLTERYPELRWPLLQRYVPSARRLVYSVSGIKDPDLGIVAASLSYKREQWPPDMGTSTVQISSADQEILAAGLRTVDGLVTRGIFELELLTDAAGLLAIDLNPRAFGFINLDIALGNDLPWLWLQSTLGPVIPQPRPTHDSTLEARHTMLHFLRELSVGRSRTAARPAIERRDPHRPRAWISILGYRSDPLPMLLSHALLLRNPRSLLRTFWSISRKERLNTDATLSSADGRQ